MNMSTVKFGRGSDTHGRDSRYWDGDDRRRDEDYNEDVVDGSSRDEPLESHHGVKGKNDTRKSHTDKFQGTRNELKLFEEKLEASLKNVGQSGKGSAAGIHVSDYGSLGMENEEIDLNDEYDDGIDSHDALMEEDEDTRHDEADSDPQKILGKDAAAAIEQSSQDKIRSIHSLDNTHTKSVDVHVGGRTTIKSTIKRKKRRKFSSLNCEMKFLNSSRAPRK